MKLSNNIFLIVLYFTAVVALSFFLYTDSNFEPKNINYDANGIVPQAQHQETVKVLILSYSRYIQGLKVLYLIIIWVTNNILLLSRSGSSVLGELMSLHPSTSYTFEPFRQDNNNI